jgi:hypothetical protein
MMRPARPITAMIVALAGMIAWGLHFALIYGVATLACLQPQRATPAFDFRIVAAAMTVILIAGTAWCILRFTSRDSRNGESLHFLKVLAVSLGLLALTAIVWATSAIFIVTDCRTQ